MQNESKALGSEDKPHEDRRRQMMQQQNSAVLMPIFHWTWFWGCASTNSYTTNGKLIPNGDAPAPTVTQQIENYSLMGFFNRKTAHAHTSTLCTHPRYFGCRYNGCSLGFLSQDTHITGHSRNFASVSHYTHICKQQLNQLPQTASCSQWTGSPGECNGIHCKHCIIKAACIGRHKQTAVGWTTEYFSALLVKNLSTYIWREGLLQENDLRYVASGGSAAWRSGISCRWKATSVRLLQHLCAIVQNCESCRHQLSALALLKCTVQSMHVPEVIAGWGPLLTWQWAN